MSILSAAVAGGMARRRSPSAPPSGPLEPPPTAIVFDDPVTGREVWRLTTDGAQNSVKFVIGDQSSESRSFSYDSKKITYMRNNAITDKPRGVYMLDLVTGDEIFLTATIAAETAAPIFSKDDTEVYYYDGPNALVKAVNVSTLTARTIVSIPDVVTPSKLTLNADGTYIACHQNGTPKKTAIFTPGGSFISGWEWPGSFVGDDATQWHPTDPKIVYAHRDHFAFWNVDTLAQLSPSSFGHISHSAWHPNGDWLFLVNDALREISTGDIVLSPMRTTGFSHPNFDPTGAALGGDCPIVLEGRPDTGAGPANGAPFIYISTPNLLVDTHAETAGNRVCVHYSTSSLNSAHIHPHYSWDGQLILWASDCAELSQGTPPGGTGGNNKIDLFIVPMTV